MKCPKCESKELSVRSTKGSDSKNIIYRYRTCDNCGYKFKTIECIQDGWTKDYYKEKYEFLKESILTISRKINE